MAPAPELAWARTPGHDEWHRRLNWPAFLDLLPAPGGLTLDLGCGDGRGGVAACADLAKARRRPAFLHWLALRR